MWDPGWRRAVNGERAEVLRANYNQRAVRVPAGRSHVDLEYRPRGLELGAAITVVTLLTPGLLFGLTRSAAAVPAQAATDRSGA